MLSNDQYARFWAALIQNTGTFASSYVAKLIEKVMKYLEDPKKALKRKTKEGSKTLLRQVFLMKNTVALLGLYIELNETSADLQAAVQKAHGFKKVNTLEGEDRKLHLGLLEAIDFIVKPAARSATALIISVTMYGDSGISGSLTDTNFLPLAENSHKEFHLYFPGLRYLLLEDPTSVLIQLQKMIGNLQRVGSQTRARLQIQSLLYVVREFLTMRPTTDTAWLEDISELVTTILRWPIPTSHIARHLLEFLQNEIASPGHALRTLMHFEFQDLDPRVERKKLGKIMKARRGTLFEDILPCHTIIVDDSSNLARTTGAILDTLPKKDLHEMLRVLRDGEGEPKVDKNDRTIEESNLSENDIYDSDSREKLLIDMRRSILVHILSCDFDLSNTDPKDPLNLQSVDPETISAWYVKALEVCNEALLLGETESASRCKQHRETNLSELLKQIDSKPFRVTRCAKSDQKSAEAVASRAEVRLQPPPPPPTDENSPIEQLGPANIHTPHLPPVSFHFQSLKALNKDSAQFRTGMQNRNIIYDTDDDRTMRSMLTAKVKATKTAMSHSGGDMSDSTYWTFAGRAMASADWSLLTSADEINNNEEYSQRTLKWGLLGSNKALHRLLSILHDQHVKDPATFKNLIDLRVYLIPDNSSDLANYVAWVDMMYERHVYKSFVEAQPVLPAQTVDAKSAEHQGDHEHVVALPYIFQRDSLEQYMRFANQLFPVVTWLCQCWDPLEPYELQGDAATAREDIETDDPCDIMIPFLISVEIGLMCDVEQYRQNKPAYQDDRLEVSFSIHILHYYSIMRT